MFDFKSLLSEENTKWAKRNLIAADSKYKMMLTINHWAISNCVDPEACRKELMALLSIRAQTSSWAVDLREKQQAYEKQTGSTEVPAELLSEKDYYILARNFDYTYNYSDSSSVWNAGHKQAAYLDTIVARLPHLKDAMGEFAHQIQPLGLSDELNAVINKYNPDLDIKWNSDYTCIDFDSKAYYKAFISMEKALREMASVAENWRSRPVLIWSPYVPPKTYGLTTPHTWTDKIEEFSDILNEIFKDSYNQRLLAKMFSMKLYNYHQIHMEPVSPSPTERKVTVHYGPLVFYHGFQFCVNKVTA